ncbi:hypothetical protein CP532_5069 [Ophiocordyceps camponoti-leonardi (nom. inval.)]|nr:hypothetical protein CP532_5069 [Ophiocordyceps camponoti-leonardi (nom. inval.)]
MPPDNVGQGNQGSMSLLVCSCAYMYVLRRPYEPPQLALRLMLLSGVLHRRAKRGDTVADWTVMKRCQAVSTDGSRKSTKRNLPSLCDANSRQPLS